MFMDLKLSSCTKVDISTTRLNKKSRDNSFITLCLPLGAAASYGHAEKFEDFPVEVKS